MPLNVFLKREWDGSPLPAHITTPLPKAAELMSLCTDLTTGVASNMAYPADAEFPVFWIKYGQSMKWNELAAMKTAHDGLRSLKSPVKAPAIYYGCQVIIPRRDNPRRISAYRTFLVMEYIRGKTARQRLDEARDSQEVQNRIYDKIALALSELHRIPVPKSLPPSAIDGGLIRNRFFDENEAPRHYRNVGELEQHLNAWIGTESQQRIKNLAEEPMVFCYSDIWPGNFLIDDEGSITVVDFEHASFLPSSFSKFVLAEARSKIGRDLRDMVTVPVTKGIDNTLALFTAARGIVFHSGQFARLGKRLLTDCMVDEPDRGDKVITDAPSQGSMVPKAV